MTAINQFLRMIRVFLTPRGRLLRSRLSGGAIVFGRNRPGFGGRGIYIFRDSIEPEFRHLEEFLEPSGVFIDIGANTGIYTIKAAHHFARSGGEVVAIEPNRDVLSILDHSIRINGLTNVRLRNLCVGEHTGPGTLWKNFNKPNLFSLVQRDGHASGVPTEIVTLDDLLSSENLNRVDYVKLDVEGAEVQVLAGGMKTIERFRPIIQMEVTISDVAADLNKYSTFQAPQSPNKVCIPDEHWAVGLPNKLGWVQQR